MRRAVDLDGTLAHYTRWEGQLVIGPPIPRMVQRVKDWLAAGDDVFIYTARLNDDPELSDAGTPATVAAVMDWCERHLGRRLPVVQKAMFAQLWDDRAVQVVVNEGVTVLEKALEIIRARQRCESEGGHTLAASCLREVANEIEGLTPLRPSSRIKA